jgi:uncharacterized protein DUF4129
MAEPLARSHTIGQLEAAVEVLRQAPSGTLLTHWIGSAPLAFAALLSWNSVTNTRTADASWAGQSILLALLLVWMNCCRTVFAGRLWRNLRGVSDRSWTARRVFRLAAIQSFSGATKLLVLPFSLLILFPWANTVAFYRTLAVAADQEELTPRQVLAQARRLASFRSGENWAILALLILLQLVVFLNVAIVMAVLPQLVRMLTGYESTYSRSGLFWVQNPMFLLLVLAISWLAFDPFAQAVHCIRAFEAESVETGEDLRCGLRRIRMAVTAAALVMLLVAAPKIRAEVSPADLETAVHQAMQSPEYDWRFPPAPAAANTPWIVNIVDRMMKAVGRAADSVRHVIGQLFRWVMDQLFPKSSGQNGGAPPGAGLNWTVAALIALVVCAGALLAWRRQRRRGSRRQDPTPRFAAEVRLDAPDLTADLLSEDRWLELADRCVTEQNFRLALRALYLASLAWLGRRDVLSIHPGKTNHQYETELARRTRSFPAARSLFAGNIVAFERAWYGLHTVSIEEVVEFRQRAEELKSTLMSSAGVAA